MIDGVVLLCPPADVCLLRGIQRNLAARAALKQSAATEADLNKIVIQIVNDLRHYDNYLGLAYQTTVAQLATHCDL